MLPFGAFCHTFDLRSWKQTLVFFWVATFFDGRGFAERQFSLLKPVSENPYNLNIVVYLDQILHAYLS